MPGPYTYTLLPGHIIESDEPLDVEQITDARAKLEAGTHRIGNVAEEVGARVYTPPTTTAHLFGLNG